MIKPKYIEELQQIFANAEDVKYSTIQLPKAQINIVYIEGLLQSASIGDLIIEPMKKLSVFQTVNSSEIIDVILSGQLYAPSIKSCTDLDTCVNSLLHGNVALISDNKTIALVDLHYYNQRSITEPTAENVVNGSKDCFVESLRTNTATLRSKIRSSSLKYEQIVIGQRSQTSVNIVYFEGIANPNLIDNLHKRVSNINVDHALTTTMISSFISEKIHTFPSILYTERPDKFAADILEGCVGLIVDGLPIGFIMPATLLRCLQAPEDYSKNYIIASILRCMRFILMITTLLLPSFYVAILSFHQEMMPRKLAISIELARAGIPFPTFIEVILMLAAFEVLVEAGLRLPRNFGQAVSIVGAVIVGQATVTAKILSPAVVVVIALTAISSYAIPNQDFSNSLRIWRLIFVFFSALLGLTGISLAMLILLSIWCGTENLGVPFMAPFVINNKATFKDTIFRSRVTKHKYRPEELNPVDSVRR